MRPDQAQTLLEEWRARARAALAQVNAGVAETLELIHLEDDALEGSFGAPTKSERQALEQERREIAELEARNRAEPTAPERRRDKLWAHRKLRGGR